MYKEPNIYLVAHSHGSLDLYPKNTGNAFTNVLKTKVNLNPNNDHEVALTNLHVPSYCCLLHKNDHENSNIQFNIGLFRYSQGKFKLDKNINKKIFSLAPDKNIKGLYTLPEYERFDFLKKTTKKTTSGGELGKDTPMSQKDKFMEELNNSLVLENETDQRLNFNLIHDYMKHHEAYRDIKFDMLYGKFFSDTDLFLFNNLNFLDQDQMHFLMSNLLKTSGLITSQKPYEDLINKIFNFESVQMYTDDDDDDDEYDEYDDDDDDDDDDDGLTPSPSTPSYSSSYPSTSVYPKNPPKTPLKTTPAAAAGNITANIPPSLPELSFRVYGSTPIHSPLHGPQNLPGVGRDLRLGGDLPGGERLPGSFSESVGSGEGFGKKKYITLIY